MSGRFGLCLRGTGRGRGQRRSRWLGWSVGFVLINNATSLIMDVEDLLGRASVEGENLLAHRGGKSF